MGNAVKLLKRRIREVTQNKIVAEKRWATNPTSISHDRQLEITKIRNDLIEEYTQAILILEGE